MIREFKEFAIRGNLVDIAVGFVLGVAFSTVVTSLVEDVLTPLVAAIAGEPDFSDLSMQIGEAEIRYGAFLNALVAFLLVAAALFFFVVKPYNALRARMADEEAPAPPEEIVLLREIRDELRRG